MVSFSVARLHKDVQLVLRATSLPSFLTAVHQSVFARGGEEKALDPCKWEKGVTDDFISFSLFVSPRDVTADAWKSQH